jgi:hypothetical protein
MDGAFDWHRRCLVLQAGPLIANEPAMAWRLRLSRETMADRERTASAHTSGGTRETSDYSRLHGCGSIRPDSGRRRGAAGRRRARGGGGRPRRRPGRLSRRRADRLRGWPPYLPPFGLSPLSPTLSFPLLVAALIALTRAKRIDAEATAALGQRQSLKFGLKNEPPDDSGSAATGVRPNVMDQ